MSGLFHPDTKFMQLLNKAADVIIVSVLFALCCIPVVTLVPAAAALYYTAVKVIRRDVGMLFKEFFSAFKSNLKRGIPLSLIGLAYLALVYLATWVADGMAAQGTLIELYPAILRLFYLPVLLVLPYLAPVLSRFDYKVFPCIHVALYLSVRQFLRTLALLGVLALFALLVYFIPLTGLFLSGLIALYASLLLEPVFKKMTPPFVPENEDDPVPWYLL